MSRLLARNRALFQKTTSTANLELPPLRLASFTTTSIPQNEAETPTINHVRRVKSWKHRIDTYRDTTGAPSTLYPAWKGENPPKTVPEGSFQTRDRSTTTKVDLDTSHKDSDIISLLSKPTWSVRSLLPPESPTQTITQAQLHHLLRLSALPLPKNQAEEEKMLQSLHSQLHFVGDIQSVDTEGVEPLVRIAEETKAGRKEATIGLEDLREVLDKEVVSGRNKRRRRVRDAESAGRGEDWDVFKTASEIVEVPGSGRYFVVRSGKERKKEKE